MNRKRLIVFIAVALAVITASAVGLGIYVANRNNAVIQQNEQNQQKMNDKQKKLKQQPPPSGSNENIDEGKTQERTVNQISSDDISGLQDNKIDLINTEVNTNVENLNTTPTTTTTTTTTTPEQTENANQPEQCFTGVTEAGDRISMFVFAAGLVQVDAFRKYTDGMYSMSTGMKKPDQSDKQWRLPGTLGVEYTEDLKKLEFDNAAASMTELETCTTLWNDSQDSIHRERGSYLAKGTFCLNDEIQLNLNAGLEHTSVQFKKKGYHLTRVPVWHSVANPNLRMIEDIRVELTHKDKSFGLKGFEAKVCLDTFLPNWNYKRFAPPRQEKRQLLNASDAVYFKFKEMNSAPFLGFDNHGKVVISMEEPRSNSWHSPEAMKQELFAPADALLIRKAYKSLGELCRRNMAYESRKNNSGVEYLKFNSGTGNLFVTLGRFSRTPASGKHNKPVTATVELNGVVKFTSDAITVEVREDGEIQKVGGGFSHECKWFA